jgi:hypothetical protein
LGTGEAFGEEALAEGEELGSFVRLLVEELSGEIGEGDGLGVSHGVAPVKLVLGGERSPTGESVAWGGAGNGGDEGEVIEGRGDKDFGFCWNGISLGVASRVDIIASLTPGTASTPGCGSEEIEVYLKDWRDQ